MPKKATGKSRQRRNQTEKGRTRVHVVFGNGKIEDVYFTNGEHYRLVKEACDESGLSMSSWLVQAGLKQARAELRK